MENYFELFEIPVSFHPDATELKQKFYALSKQFHPDRFVKADDEGKEQALRKAAQINEAYNVLKDADKTMSYVLKIKNVLNEDEKYALPSNFLMEMMELNEAISDYESDAENILFKNQAVQELSQQMDNWNKEVEPLINSFEQEGGDEDKLLQIKDFFFRKKYLLRISERLTTFASR